MIHVIKQSRLHFLSTGVVLLTSLIACGKTPVSERRVIAPSASAAEKPAAPVSDPGIIIFSAPDFRRPSKNGDSHDESLLNFGCPASKI